MSGNKDSAKGNENSAVRNAGRTVGSEDSAVGCGNSAVRNAGSAVGSEDSAVGCGDSAARNAGSAVGSEDGAARISPSAIEALLPLLNLAYPGLDKVKEALRQNRPELAAAELMAYFAGRKMPAGYPDAADREAVAAHIRASCADELALSRTTADEVLEQTFRFRFPMDMERTQIPVAFTGAIDWNHVPAGDVEWAYMLNRHRYWVALGQMYVLTGEERYAEGLCGQLEDWIGRNPLPAGPGEVLTWRSIEAGLRGTNWTKALSYVLHSPSFTPGLLVKCLHALYVHAEYLAAPYSGWKNISNWGVLECCGLLHIARFLPELRLSEHWSDLALERMRTTASLQILPDGLHWEQSPTYHHEVLSSYLEMIHLAHSGGISLEPAVLNTVQAAAHASLGIAQPDGGQPMTGDSDRLAVAPLMAAAALLFNDPVLRFGGGERLDYDNAWLFGRSGLRQYAGMSAKPPQELSQAYTHSGNYIMRTDWDRQALYLLLRCAPLGGGHGHADSLHIDIHAYGRSLLTDLGRYNYSDSEPLRQTLKRPSAHNTFVVDDTDFTEVIDTWQYGAVASPAGIHWVTLPEFDYAEAGHDGYRRLEVPVYPRRRILFIKPYGWLLVDSAEGRG
ncbi:alginate lyase family protein [Paenibacillus tepidiphilus]|uniref:alginate lyase family protein n=1 Tax=Paenibacillus tepidiphilus TaxID=2608683 RepID=UPI00193D7A12|nr:alginate lyase family protein [Paenibacillus tepidiphilus]